MCYASLREKNKNKTKKTRQKKKGGFSRFPFFVYTTCMKERHCSDVLREEKRFMVAAATTERTRRQERVIKRHIRRRITVGNFLWIILNKEKHRDTHIHRYIYKQTRWWLISSWTLVIIPLSLTTIESRFCFYSIHKHTYTWWIVIYHHYYSYIYIYNLLVKAV